MSKAQAGPIRDDSVFRELSPWYKEDDVLLEDKRKWGLAWYNIENLAQDQVIIRIGRSTRIDTYRGLHVGTDQDSQSDYTYVPPVLLESEKEIRAFVLDLAKQRLKEELSTRVWKRHGRIADQELTCSVEVEEQADARSIDTTADDVSEWTSDQLATAILHPQTESDMARLREMILIAEDRSFTVEQSQKLAPWLLSFAERRRDSSDPQDEAVVWSAIRTGASMLRPQAADSLRALLEPMHSIETSLVTVKMLGRIFEAQPPAELDQHQELANEVYQMANSLSNRYVISSSQNAAMAQLAIYALTAMASRKTQQIVETVKQLGVTWFTQQTLRELRDLSSMWENQPTAVGKAPRQLLDKVLKMLE